MPEAQATAASAPSNAGHQVLEHGVVAGAVAAVDDTRPSFPPTPTPPSPCPRTRRHWSGRWAASSGRLAEGTSRPPRAAMVSNFTVSSSSPLRPAAPRARARARDGCRPGAPCSRTASASRRTPSSICATGTAENDSRSARAPPPSTKKALPGVKVTPRHCARGSRRGGVHALGQREQQREAAAGLRPGGARRHEPAQALEQRVAAPSVLLERPRLVAVEQTPLAEVVDGGLDERARVDVGELLGHLEPLHQLGRGHDPAQPQAREQDLGERAEVDHEARRSRAPSAARAGARRRRACRRSHPPRWAAGGGRPGRGVGCRAGSPMVSPVGLCALGWQ